MQNQETEIIIDSQKRTMRLIAPVQHQLAASQLADRLDNLPYLKVSERKCAPPMAIIMCHTIKGLFTIEQFQKDLETMSDLIINNNENIHNPAPAN